jgi:hypothetical protein
MVSPAPVLWGLLSGFASAKRDKTDGKSPPAARPGNLPARRFCTLTGLPVRPCLIWRLFPACSKSSTANSLVAFVRPCLPRSIPLNILWTIQHLTYRLNLVGGNFPDIAPAAARRIGRQGAGASGSNPYQGLRQRRARGRQPCPAPDNAGAQGEPGRHCPGGGLGGRRGRWCLGRDSRKGTSATACPGRQAGRHSRRGIRAC